MPRTDYTRVDSVDGMRGFGSVVVLLFHVFLTFSLLDKSPFFVPNIVYNGNIAVKLFFVLSGFSLSIGFLSKRDQGIDDGTLLSHLQRMAAARYFRLALPAFASSLVVLVLVKSGLNYYQHLPEELRNPWWSWAYTSRDPSFRDLMRFSFFDIFFPTTFIPFVEYKKFYFNTNLWTMSVEFPASYMVFIFLALFGAARMRLYMCLGSIAFFSVFDSMYGFFFAGIALADIYVRGWSADRWQRVLMIVFIVVLFCPEIKHTWSQTIYCSVFVFCGLYGKPVRTLFSSRIFRYLGKVSFSLYLVHMPIVISLQSYLFLSLTERLPPHEVILLSGGATVLASFVAAHLFSFVDDWAIAMSHKAARLIVKQPEIRRA